MTKTHTEQTGSNLLAHPGRTSDSSPKILFLNRCLYLILFYREQLCRIERQVIHSVDTYILILRFIEFFPENVIWIFNQKTCIVQKVTLL